MKTTDDKTTRYFDAADAFGHEVDQRTEKCKREKLLHFIYSTISTYT